MARFIVLVAAIGLLACASPQWGGDRHGDPQGRGLDASVFSALQFSFADPGTGAIYRIAGPYRVLRSAPEAVELEGLGYDYSGASRLLLFVHADALWARARIGDKEFLTRVN